MTSDAHHIRELDLEGGQGVDGGLELLGCGFLERGGGGICRERGASQSERDEPFMPCARRMMVPLFCGEWRADSCHGFSLCEPSVPCHQVLQQQ